MYYPACVASPRVASVIIVFVVCSKCCLMADESETSLLIETIDAVIAECRQQESSQQHFNQIIIKLVY